MMSSDRIVWIRDEKRNPVACIAIRFSYKTDRKTPNDAMISGAEYGVSIRNPKDQINKAMGRNIAEGRIPFSTKLSGAVDFADDLVTAREATAKVIRDMALLPNLPTRVSRLATALANSWVAKKELTVV